MEENAGMEIAALIDVLSRPAAYPFPVTDVGVRQTHISAVFLVRDYVYKVKKPVNPGFLDFSTLEKRHFYCEEEVRLNRRLAPHVYLGVVPIVRTQDGYQLEADGEVVEWAVKMLRLPDGATLLEHLHRGEISGTHVETLASRIAAFHRSAETGTRIAACGRFERVSKNILDIFDQAAPQSGTTVTPGVFARTRRLAEQALARLQPLIDRRADRLMPRDCHGDLHLDHVYFFPDREPPADLVIIDCIEFNERFRFIDPIADMAFPTMDFAFHGRRDLARAFEEAYFKASGDEDGRPLLPLYTAYRATVRGMVDGLLLSEKETRAEDRDAALKRARAHWLLALTELETPKLKPCLILVAGLPGTGKSTLARGLEDRAGFSVIRSDVVRKELAGLPVVGETSAQSREAIYSPEWNVRTYAECLRRAESLLFDGKRVIVDATFREEKSRRTFLDAAIRWGVPGRVFHCQVDAETARRHLAHRKGDASDADWNIYLQVAKTWEDFGTTTRQVLYPIATAEGAEQALTNALEVLRASGL
jgi:uncharacterized protein